jgi:hypothetical protein
LAVLQPFRLAIASPIPKYILQRLPPLPPEQQQFFQFPFGWPGRFQFSSQPSGPARCDDRVADLDYAVAKEPTEQELQTFFSEKILGASDVSLAIGNFDYVMDDALEIAMNYLERSRR